MASQTNGKLSHEYPMAGGDSNFSYSKYSFYQRNVVLASKFPLQEVVAKSLDVKKIAHDHKKCLVADLGCSVGPNTFISVQNIIEAVNLAYNQNNEPNSPTLQFQVFFSDIAINDFNLLFRALPKNKDYWAAGVPGSFYGRLFPDAYLDIVNCSFGLHFPSKVPTKSFTNGKTPYSQVGDEAVSAYSKQYAIDMECFLDARALELVPGGLLLFAVPARPDDVSPSDAYFNVLINLLGSCVQDLADKGRITDEAKLDSFSIPVYITSPSEVKAAVEKCGYFELEKLESLPEQTNPDSGCKPENVSIHIRAITEQLMKEQFGAEILDELYELYTKKIEEAYAEVSCKKAINIFVALKRKDVQA